MKRAIRWYDYITINIFWFALTARAQILTALLVPLLVQQFVGEESKGTYVGSIRLWALMIAILVQALMGMLSDRSKSRFGRRRPFILAGALGHVVILVFIGVTASMEGMAGYWVLFVLYILTMLASDTAHVATTGLIPDLIPEEKRGRFSGVKAIFELPLPLIFVSLVVGGMVAAGQLWLSIGLLMVVLVVCAAITMLVPEEPLEEEPFPLDWEPFLRLLLMVAVFTAIILGTGALVKGFLGLSLDLTPNATWVLTAVVGLVAMLVATALGVWLAIRISIGPDIRDNPNFTWWVMNRLAFLIPTMSLSGFLLFFLQERFPDLAREKAAGPASLAVMFVGVFILICAMPSGWLADRIGRKPVIALAGVLATAGTVVVLLSTSFPILYVGSSLIGAGIGFFYSANWALGTDIVPKEQAGRFLGLANLAGAGSGAIGAYIGGPIADQSGYVLLFAIYGSLFLLSLVALVGIREVRKVQA